MLVYQNPGQAHGTATTRSSVQREDPYGSGVPACAVNFRVNPRRQTGLNSLSLCGVHNPELPWIGSDPTLLW